MEQKNKGSLLKSENAEKAVMGDGSHKSSDGFSILHIIEQQTRNNPQAIAVSYGETSLTYHELDTRSNQLAHFLRTYGVKEDGMYPICMERSLEMIIGILGILKAGGAYVPIDPEYPQHRVDLILKETNAAWVLCHENSRPKLPTLSRPDILVWEIIQPEVNAQSVDKPLTDLEPHHLAYVIFTSGSTGTPKGVLVEHAQLFYATQARNRYYPGFSSLLLVPSFSFDAAVGAIFGCLSHGNRLILSSQEALQDPLQLHGLLAETDTVLCVPSYYQFLLEEDLIALSKISAVILGGEALTQELVAAHFAIPKDILLFNEYGPTETTVWATVNQVEPQESPISIGRPIADTRIYILDEQGNLLPDGAVGELHIGGRGVARGYLNDEKSTGEKFLNNPFDPNPGSRMYKTGDLGYKLPDHKIAYVGRLDDQIKINGHRVEPGEIEGLLKKHQAVKQAVVIAKELENGGKQLVAFVVPEGKFDSQAIKKYLKDKLPAPLVPHVWVALKGFPLNPQGKTDRLALRALDLGEFNTKKHSGPRSSSERTQIAIWERLLKVKGIGIHDDFFELGGNSLLAMKFLAQARKELNLQASIRELFEHPTVAAFQDHFNSTQVIEAARPKTMLPRPNHIPISFNQESLWIIDRMSGTIPYHLPIVMKIDGELDKAALTRSFKQLIARHEALRTVIQGEDDMKFQHILDAGHWELATIEGQEYTYNEADFRNKLDELIRVPFDLSKDYMIRASLIRLSPNEHVLLLVLHHIAFDAWSRAVLLSDFLAFYNSYKTQTEPSISPPPIQYADYAWWQRKQFESKIKKSGLAYWKHKLEGVVPLQLPHDHTEAMEISSAGAEVHFLLKPELVAGIRGLAGKERATVFMTLLAAFKTLLYRYSSQEDICVGTAAAGRQEPETEHLIGYFINTLALRTQVAGNASFLELLRKVKTTVLEAFDHQEVPFEKVVSATGTERETTRHPLFQVMFLLQDVPDIPPLEMEDANLSLLPQPQRTAKFDLTFSLTETPEGLRGTVEYRTDLFQPGTIERMVGHYRELLHTVIQDPKEELGKVNMLPSAEKHQLLNTFNPAAVPYPRDISVIDLIEEQVRRTPERLALIFESESLSYGELNARSNRLAHLLREKGVGEETLVLVCIERSLEMVIAILGILKAGGAYVPIDPEYPEERIRFIQEDTGARIAVGSKKSFSKLSGLDHLDLVDLRGNVLNDPNLSIENLRLPVRPNHLAYVIYTSGSTGTPKGVLIEHSSFYSFICWCREEFAKSRFESVYAATSICFDLSIFELFYPLSVGKPVRILHNGLQISQYLNADSWVMVNTVPSVIDHLVKEGADLRNASVINMAGEAIPEKLLMALDTEKTEVRNLYGPTEDTTYSTCYSIGKDKKPLIGKPISNTRIYIVSPENGLNPVGIPGEICIGGSGLARGYLNREELTEEKFVADPFSGGGDRMYRTGDLGRWMPDGQIRFLGRRDDQVKIRGFRIELGEIERTLLTCDGVRQAAVLAIADKAGNQQLVGYVDFEGDFQPKSAVDFLKRKLPAYMVPNLWVSLDKIPLTINGKVDKKALPPPEGQQHGESEYVAPRNKKEKSIAEIWKKLLNSERVGIYDDFFRLGGNSLLAIRFISQANKAFGSELRIRDLFECPTIEKLSKRQNLISETADSQVVTLTKQRPPLIPLSYNQESLWFIDKLNGSLHYHIPLLLNISGALDEGALAEALKTIVRRHEVLRTVIRDANGIPFQSIMTPDSWTLQVITKSEFIKEGGELMNIVCDTVNTPFDLAHDYPFRATLVHSDRHSCALIMVIHHIAADGWSVSLLIDELTALYKDYAAGMAPTLAPLRFQYADYAVWQRKRLTGPLLERQSKYWKQKLGNLTPLELPADYQKRAVQSTRGSVRTFHVEKNLTDELLRLGQQQGATLFMTLLAAFKLLLFKNTSQQDLCVGTANSGRQMQDLEKLIGYFINPLPIRSRLERNASFNEFLKVVKTSSLEALDNQDIPFERVLAAVGSARNPGKNPLFQVMFVLQNFTEVPELQWGPVKIKQEPLRQNTSKFDLSLTIIQKPHGLSGSMEYSSDLFKSQTIDRMISDFMRLLNLIVSEPDTEIIRLKSPIGPIPTDRQQKFLTDKVSRHKSLGLGASQRHHSRKTQKEKLIARIWEDALDMKNINLSDNFFEIGGHSLVAVQVMTHLEKELGTKLPLSILFEYPTIQTLARAVESKHKKKRKWKSLVPIKASGSKSPLYIVPGGGASLLPFYAIAKNLDPDQPLFGLQPKGLNGNGPPLTSVMSIASHFVAEILRHNPQGPYSLAGYSFGGIIAFEMAKQLRKAGKEVKHLIMFDTIAYQADPGDSWMRKLGSKIKFSVGKRKFDMVLLTRYPANFGRLKKESFRKKFESLKKLFGFRKSIPEDPIMDAIKNLEAIHIEASKNYIIEPYDGEIHLLKAKIPTYYIPEPDHLGWKSYVNKVHVREMEGEHTTMFSPPYEARFAQVLQKILDRYQ